MSSIRKSDDSVVSVQLIWWDFVWQQHRVAKYYWESKDFQMPTCFGWMAYCSFLVFHSKQKNLLLRTGTWIPPKNTLSLNVEHMIFLVVITCLNLLSAVLYVTTVGLLFWFRCNVGYERLISSSIAWNCISVPVMFQKHHSTWKIFLFHIM